MKHPTLPKGWQTSSHLYFGGLEPLPKIFLDLGQQIFSVSQLDPLLPFQKNAFSNSRKVVMPSDSLNVAVPKSEDLTSPPTLLQAGRCLHIHSPRLLQTNDPSYLSEYLLPLVGLYLGGTSQLLQQLSPCAPRASYHLVYGSVGTHQSSCSAICT